MNIKKIISDFIPYGLYRRIKRRYHKNLFINNYKAYTESGINKGNYFKDVRKNYKTVVSVQGLGFSGSGAVLDMLCEFDCCEVVGTIYNQGNSDDHNSMFECDFLRLSGCLFEIEKYLGSSNIFQNDALLNRFIDYLNTFPPFKIHPNIQKCFINFFASIVETQIFNIEGVPYNHHLRGNKESSSIFFLKPLNLSNYRELCRDFLTGLFTELNTSSKNILVFDQLLSDMEFDFERYSEYIPNVKIILVYRDPRDIYVFAKQHEKDEGWMAHDNVDNFIQWYRILTRNIDFNSKDMLIIQFEKLVLNYEYEKRRLLNYLKIDYDDGISKERMLFNPEISKKNIGIWVNSCIPKDDFDKIAKELPEFCYFS